MRTDAVLTSSSIKRRSLSDMSIRNTYDREEHKTESQQAKVPKLEIKISRNSPLRASMPANHYFDNNSSTITRSYSVSNRPNSSQGRTSPIVPQVSRRTRSSENLSMEGSFTGLMKNTSSIKSPFSFSLATPTNSLTSFKFLEAKSKSTSNAKRASRRSLDRPFTGLSSQSLTQDNCYC